jgi:hypothetical protein
VAFCNPLDRCARQAAERAFGSVQPAITTTRALEDAVKAFEVLSETVKEAILAKRTSSEIRRISVETSGLITLLEDAIAKAAQGYTTLQEILRNLPRLGSRVRFPSSYGWSARCAACEQRETSTAARNRERLSSGREPALEVRSMGQQTISVSDREELRER